MPYGGSVSTVYIKKTKVTRKTSIKDIANRVGVSIASVSYVLNGKDKEARVGKEVAARIKKAAKEMNYQPNLIARSLQSGRTRTIGLIVADISNPFFSSLARSVEDEASTHNYTVLFGSSDENATKSQTLINTLIKRQVDALIIAPAEKTEKQIKALGKSGFPFVLIDRYFPDVKTNTVRINNVDAAYRAVSHLIHNGYKRVTMVAYKTSLQHMVDRKEGFLKALKEHKIKPGKWSIFESSYDHISEDMEVIMKKALEGSSEPPDSFFFATNSLAVRGLKEINKRNLRVPDDVGVVSFDESEAMDFFYSPITHINQQTDRIAVEAVKLLMRQLGENDTPTLKKAALEQLVVEAKLVIGRSSARRL